jgi:hypothetical protein
MVGEQGWFRTTQVGLFDNPNCGREGRGNFDINCFPIEKVFVKLDDVAGGDDDDDDKE